MKVLVLGAGGQLGRELTDTLPEGVDCLALDRQGLDITDPSAIRALLAAEHPDAVINASAYTAVDRAEDEREAAFAVNRDGPANLARLAAASGIRLLHVSTDFVFDGGAGSPYPTDATTRPLGVYGESKLAGERAVQGSGADWVLVRTGWVYSRHGGNFVKTMLRLMAERDQLKVVEDQVGTPTWARNLAKTCWRLLLDGSAHGVYHWSDAGACSWYDFALAIRDEANALGMLDSETEVLPIPATEYPTPATRPSFSVLDKTRTRTQLGDAGQPWRAALREMLMSLRDAD